MIFGAESAEVLETKITNLEEQINDAEETVKTTKEDLRFNTIHSLTPNGGQVQN